MLFSLCYPNRCVGHAFSESCVSSRAVTVASKANCNITPCKAYETSCSKAQISCNNVIDKGCRQTTAEWCPHVVSVFDYVVSIPQVFKLSGEQLQRSRPKTKAKALATSTPSVHGKAGRIIFVFMSCWKLSDVLPVAMQE